MAPVAPDPAAGAGGTFLTGVDDEDSPGSAPFESTFSHAGPPQASRMAATTGSTPRSLPYIHRLNASGTMRGAGGQGGEKTASPYNVPNKHMRVYFPK